MAETCELARLRANLLVCFCSLVSLLRHLVRLGLCAVWCSLCVPVFLSVMKVELLTFFSPPSGVQVILYKGSYSQWLASPATSMIIIPGHCLHCIPVAFPIQVCWPGGREEDIWPCPAWRMTLQEGSLLCSPCVFFHPLHEFSHSHSFSERQTHFSDSKSNFFLQCSTLCHYNFSQSFSVLNIYPKSTLGYHLRFF